MIYVFITLAVMFVILIVLTVVFSKKYRKYKTSCEQKCLELSLLQEEYSKLAKAYEIKKNNKEKADEAIYDLHGGNTSADNILPKRKSRT